jgi:hypothetical protein
MTACPVVKRVDSDMLAHDLYDILVPLFEGFDHHPQCRAGAMSKEAFDEVGLSQYAGTGENRDGAGRWIKRIGDEGVGIGRAFDQPLDQFEISRLARIAQRSHEMGWSPSVMFSQFLDQAEGSELPMNAW